MPIPAEGEQQFSPFDFAAKLAQVRCGKSDYHYRDIPTAYQQALLFAARWHTQKGQKVPGTDLPYVVHICNVAMEVLLTAANTPGFDTLLAVQTALLHDVLEDTECSFSELEENFGLKVALAAWALSKPAKPEGVKSTPREKREHMQDSLRRIQLLPHEVWAVKMADRITNLQPPPKGWHRRKAMAYRTEARLILNELGQGNAYLQKRLQHKIEGYAALVEEVERQKQTAIQKAKENGSDSEGNASPKKKRFKEPAWWKKWGIKYDFSRAGQSFVLVGLKKGG